MKIVVLDGYTLNPGDLSWEPLKVFGQVAIYDRTPHELISERVKGCEIVVTNKTPLDGDLLKVHPEIKMIAVLATGYNVVDVQVAKGLGITVSNIPSYGTDAVAQFVFALLLGLAHRVETHDKTVKSGKWTGHQDFCYWETPLFELAGKKMGIIGMGKIGARTAEVAQCFGMSVLAYDVQPNLASETSTLKYVSLEELYKDADVISLHVPLFESTQNMINQSSIAKMKDGVIIINTSRGPLINEMDLCDALVSGKVAGAAVDVVSAEPIKDNNPLLKAPNIIITPHIAWAPLEARRRLLNTAIDNIRAYLKGSPQNVVS